MGSVMEGKSTTNQCVLNLVNCMLGAGVLGYPYCFKSCGFVLATCIMLVSLFSSRFSYELLLYCCHITNKKTYEDLAEQAVGRIGRQLVELCTAALNLGAIVAYLNILADVLSSVAGTIIPPGAEPSRAGYIAGVTMFGALPMALIVRDHSIVAAFSTASVGFVFLFAIVIIIFAVAPAPAIATAGALTTWKIEGLLVAFPVMAYGFTAHPYYLGIYGTMQGPSIKRMGRVTDTAMFLSASLYWLVGLGGYMLFRHRTSGDLLRNFGAASVTGLRGAYERALKLCYGLSILGAVPLVILPFYSMLLPLVGYNDEFSQRKHRTSDNNTAITMDSPTGRSTSALWRHESADVVDLHVQHDGLYMDEPQPSVFQHTAVVMLVLGAAMASALWVPNVELIFGLTGATASVVMGYILPALVFIRLVDATPELLGQGSKVKVPADVVRQWVWRRRKALALLLFGVMSGIACTDAILGAVNEEAAVVQLAQQLVAHEVVVVETNRAQQKAKEAVAAVTVVQTATKQLEQVQHNTTDTLGQLAEAAQQLDSIANTTSSKEKAVWDIHGRLQDHAQHAAETKVLRNVEVMLARVKDDINKTMVGVEGVIRQLDKTLASIRAEQAAQQAAAAKDAAGGGSDPAQVIPDSTAVTTTGAKVATSTTIGIPEVKTSPIAAAGVAATAAATPAAGAAGAAAGHGGAGGGGGGDKAKPKDRASDLALELGKTLGVYNTLTNATSAGKNLEQVRSSAVAALQALNETMQLLTKVSRAVAAARKSHKHDDQVKDEATLAIRQALNATAHSALAMRMTNQALKNVASDEATELLTILSKVAADMEKSKEKSKSTSTGGTDGASTDNLPRKIPKIDLGPNDAPITAGKVPGVSSRTQPGSTPTATSNTTAASTSPHPTSSTTRADQTQPPATSLPREKSKGAQTGTATPASTGTGPTTTTPTPSTTTTTTTPSATVPSTTTPPSTTTATAASNATAAVKSVIDELTRAVGSADARNASSADANITQVVAAMQSAITWTEGSQQQSMEAIQEKLGKSKSVVAERVIGILNDMSSQAKKVEVTDTSSGIQVASAAADTTSAATATDTSTTTAATTTSTTTPSESVILPITSTSHEHPFHSHTTTPTHHPTHTRPHHQSADSTATTTTAGGTAADSSSSAAAGTTTAAANAAGHTSAAGPVVVVSPEGRLQQAEDTAGPVVVSSAGTGARTARESEAGQGGEELPHGGHGSELSRRQKLELNGGENEADNNGDAAGPEVATPSQQHSTAQHGNMGHELLGSHGDPASHASDSTEQHVGNGVISNGASGASEGVNPILQVAGGARPLRSLLSLSPGDFDEEVCEADAA